MALRNIRIKGDAILRKKSREITEADDRIKLLAKDMIETMEAADGAGLAAVQVGVLRRMIVVLTEKENSEDLIPTVMINPKIISFEGEVLDFEGCLSVPGKTGKVRRPEKLKVKFKNLNWEDCEMEVKDISARAVAHEVDHLEGILYTDKVEGPMYETASYDEK